MQLGRVDHLALGQLDRVGDRLDVEVDFAVRRGAVDVAVGADIVDALGAEPVAAGGNTANTSFVVTVLAAQEQPAQLVQEVVDATSLPPRPRRN